MKKNMLKYLLALASVTVVGGGCSVDDYNDAYLDGFDSNPEITDVQTLKYAMTDGDYAKVADNETNKAIAKAAGADAVAALAAVKTGKCFSAAAPAKDYLPAFIASMYDSYLSNGSSVSVSYKNLRGEISEKVTAICKAGMYALTDDDYAAVWGAGTENLFFTPKQNADKYLPKILADKLTDAAAGDIVWVDFNQAETEPSDAETVFEETFDDWADTWANVVANDNASAAKWVNKLYSGNNYVQCSAFKTTGTTEVYLVSPKITITADMTFAFDACYGNYKAEGGRLKVLISSNLAEGEVTKESIAAATWTDISEHVSIPVPEGTYGTIANVCTYAMTDFVGKDVRIAFRYDGNGEAATTTVQLDNVSIVKGVKTPSAATSTLYTFNGSKWEAYAPSSVRQIKKADFAAMGSNYDSFDNSFKADVYLPIFLKTNYPYAQADDLVNLVYKYYDSASKTRSVVADEYVFDGTNWNKTEKTEILDGPFQKVGGKWNFNPSMIITLNPDKSPLSKLYYQAGIDYVIANKDAMYRYDNRSSKYLTDTEYYSGCASGYTNLNWRIRTLPAYYWKAAGEDISAYEDATSDDMAKKRASFEAFYAEVEKRFGEVMAAALGSIHSDVKMIDGIDVIYTIQALVYSEYIESSVGKVTHAFEFKLVGNGKFEYVRMYALDPQYELIQDKFFQ